MDLSQQWWARWIFCAKPRRGAEQLMAVVGQINEQQGRGKLRIGRVVGEACLVDASGDAEPRYTTRRDMIVFIRPVAAADQR